MPSFEDLLDLLFDDDPDMEIEVTIGDDDKEDSGCESCKKCEKPSKPNKPDEVDKVEEAVEKSRAAAKKSCEWLTDKYGEEKCKDIVKLASLCASISTLIEDSIPLDQTMVDEYNDLCKKVHPERSSGLACAMVYAALRHLSDEGMKSLE